MGELRCSIQAKGIADEILGVGDSGLAPLQRMLHRESKTKVALSPLLIRRPPLKVIPLTTSNQSTVIGSASGDNSTVFQGRRADSTGSGQQKVVELCSRFNKFSGNVCTFNDCRFAHICSWCMVAPHPASRYPGGRAQQVNNYNQQRYPLLPHPQV